MKHTVNVTIALIALFFFSQIIGLFVVYNYLDIDQVTGETSWKELPSVGSVRLERPDLAPEQSFWYILFAILIGTLLILFLMKYKKVYIWKAWFYMAVVICLTISLGVFIGGIPAFILSLVLGYFKIFKPYVLVHNISELFLYAGMAALFVPILNVLVMSLLLLVISLYDYYAVHKSKHMVSMAKFQSKANVFAGLFIPYHDENTSLTTKKTKKRSKKEEQKNVKHAILGGGDIAFPLLFAGVILKEYGYIASMFIPITTTIALSWLLFKSEKGKFYPAMPIISVGCFVGLGLFLLFL